MTESIQTHRTAPGRAATTAADWKIAIFEDEELFHDIQPSLVGSFSILDWILTVFTWGAWAVVPILRWRKTRHVITDKRLIDEKGGVTGTTTVETQDDDIRGDIRTSQGLIEGLLDKGTITFEIERERNRTATEREFGDREGSSREMDVVREKFELSGIRDYQDVSNTIRWIQNA